MTFNTPGSNHPLRRRTDRAARRLKDFAERLMKENPALTKEEAMDKAMAEMRDNGRGDWRAG